MDACDYFLTGFHIPEVLVQLHVPQLPKSEFIVQLHVPQFIKTQIISTSRALVPKKQIISTTRVPVPQKHVISTARARAFLCFQFFGEIFRELWGTRNGT